MRNFRKIYKLFIFFLFVYGFSNPAGIEAHNLDSVRQALKTNVASKSGEARDSVRVKLLAALAGEIYLSDPDGAILVCEEALLISQKSNYQSGLSLSYGWLAYLYEQKGDLEKALNYNLASLKIFEALGDKMSAGAILANLAGSYLYKGNIQKALEYTKKSLAIAEELGDKKGRAHTLNNLATIYISQGDIQKGLEYHLKSLKLKEEIGDKVGVPVSLLNIGNIYLGQSDTLKAIEYLNKSLQLNRELGDKGGIANSLFNIGAVFNKQNNNKSAEYFNGALKIFVEIGNKRGVASTLKSIGGLYLKNREPDKALDQFNKAVKLFEDMEEKQGMADCYIYIARIYYSKKENAKAMEYALRSKQIGMQLGFPEIIRNASWQLSSIYETLGDHKNALTNYELFVSMRDSTDNAETKKASIRSQFKYTYEKKAAQDSVAHAKESEIKNIELEKQKTEITAKRNQQYALFGGLAMVIIFAGFMFNRFKVTQKQKNIIELKEQETQKQNAIITNQKKVVEEKQKEILDSIHYAKRIQTALITSEKYIEKNLNKLQKGK